MLLIFYCLPTHVLAGWLIGAVDLNEWTFTIHFYDYFILFSLDVTKVIYPSVCT